MTEPAESEPEFESPMLPAERRESMLAELRARGPLRVTDIARTLGVSAVTVRRDVAQLADEGVIERVHGGIRLPRASPSGIGAGAGAAVGTWPTHAAAGVGTGVVAGSWPSGAGAATRAWPTGSAQPMTVAVVEDQGPASGPDEAALPPVGMVVPSLDYYWPQIIHGARDAALVEGLRIVLRGSSYDDVGDVRRQTEWLLTTVGIRGLLIAPPTRGEAAADLIAWLGTLPIPVVLVERAATIGPFHEHVESVTTDHAYGAGLAVWHLAAEGHRRVGFIASATSPHTAAVRRGWREAAEEIGLDLVGTPDTLTPDHRDPQWNPCRDAFLEECLATGTKAVLAHSDREAISLVARCQERGIRVPEDLAVVAYDDEVAGLTEPALTAVRPAKPTLGRTAVQLLAQRMREGAERPVHRIQISPQLVIRGSSVARRDKRVRAGGVV